ncbi:hypothetical protein OUZ56_008115 [Daphnia magna]|uniref:Uncharacterized protein n=1 Tax=Daphnia magna TaxID=35525 RepID=A0ABR0ABZ5_9CRUS|nr:hypothetical protein OUZ56_008115 [Daphnia magna]
MGLEIAVFRRNTVQHDSVDAHRVPAPSPRTMRHGIGFKNLRRLRQWTCADREGYLLRKIGIDLEKDILLYLHKSIGIVGQFK